MGGGQIRNAASELRFGTEQVLLELLENLGLETTEPTRFQTDPSPGLARLYSAVFGRPNWKPCAAQLFKEGISVRFFGQALIETFLHTEVIVARQPWHPESRLEAMCASGIPYDGSDPQRSKATDLGKETQPSANVVQFHQTLALGSSTLFTQSSMTPGSARAFSTKRRND